MIRKIIYGIMGAAVLLVFGLIFGLIIGAVIGGNFMTGFEFAGVRGYEAVGDLGALILGSVGLFCGIPVGIKISSINSPSAFRIILIILFIIFILLFSLFLVLSFI